MALCLVVGLVSHLAKLPLGICFFSKLRCVIEGCKRNAVGSSWSAAFLQDDHGIKLNFTI